MNIIDNFLPKKEFELIKSTLLGSSFPWYYNDFILERGTEDCHKVYNYQLTHSFFSDNKPSDFFYLVNPLIKKLKITSLLRIKSNLSPRADRHIIQGMHTDYNIKCKTSIFYINTNNGYTLLENGKKVKSVQNRIVTFDSSLLHSSVTCTNEKVRCVINLNYY
jgi:hypothetical protein